MNHFLSSQERDSLKIQHRLERDKRVCDRIKAVLLSDEGWDFREIAHALLLSDEAVRQHVQKQRMDGFGKASEKKYLQIPVGNV